MRTFITIFFCLYQQLTAISQEKQWLQKTDSVFSLSTSEHFSLYAFKSCLSEKEQADLLKKREVAYKKISRFFNVNSDLDIKLFVFPTEQLKIDLTGHKGLGWAFDNNIVEVYNDSIKVDPYHELVHIIGYTISKPAAMVDEGLAVYISQLYGNKPFSDLLGYPSKSINEIIPLLKENNELINIRTLFSYEEIGSSNNVPLAYCQSASFVEFLIEQYGKNKFLTLFELNSKSDNANNHIVFRNIYGKDIDEMENEWAVKNGFKIR